MNPRRSVLLVVVLAALATALTAAPWWFDRPPPPRPTASVTRPDRSADPLGVLRAWDGRRASAWAHGDAGALRALYTGGSRTAAADLAMLRSYAARGLRVEGMRTQVLAARVRVRTAERLVLVVTDRLVGAVARGPGTRVVLPVDAASTRTVSLRLVAGEWRVSEVRDQASAAEITAVTSRSRKS